MASGLAGAWVHRPHTQILENKAWSTGGTCGLSERSFNQFNFRLPELGPADKSSKNFV